MCARAQGAEDENIWLRASIFTSDAAVKSLVRLQQLKKPHSNSIVSSFNPPSLLQTEIAKRLNAILAQIMPFLSQEVSFKHT